MSLLTAPVSSLLTFMFTGVIKTDTTPQFFHNISITYIYEH